MKKMLLILSAVFVLNNVNAQLSKTKWKGTIETNTKIDVVFDYGKDSVKVNSMQDGSNIETMTYSVKDNIITLKKVSGQSECDGTNTGQYSFDIKDNILSMKLISDNCNDRSEVLSNSKWTKLD